MDKATLSKGGGTEGGSRWLRRTALVTFCLLLVVTVGVVFTRVIAARIPEQRATLEKLITDRTGLAVRFDNVHFAWDLDGMNAVFTRVVLDDSKAGRVRVVAPELKVEFDTWDFLRHQQFSLGHVTLSSPDIEIIGDAEDSSDSLSALRLATNRGKFAPADESALMKRYLAWAELMPIGRIEVEGARVHLLRRSPASGQKVAARHSFTLSQAVVSRSARVFSAHGTLLLAQDVGQSLFVSARLEGLGSGSKVSGDLRVIARRVFLDKLPIADLAGRGTVDATISLRNGLVHAGHWQASAYELEIGGDEQRRFDHVSVKGVLAREGQELSLELTDLQLTRGARLERAPTVNLSVMLAAGTTQVERLTLRAERLPFMAAELAAAALPLPPGELLSGGEGDWQATAGVLRDVHFDSGRRSDPAKWRFEARLSGLEIARQTDGARLEQLAAQLRCDARELALHFDPAQQATLYARGSAESRPLILSGEVALSTASSISGFRFKEFSAASGGARVAANGSWTPAAKRPEPLHLQVAGFDRALLQETWMLLAADLPVPETFADLEQMQLLEAEFDLRPGADGAVDWNRSSGSLAFAGLTTAGQEMPRLEGARGVVEVARGAGRLVLESGSFEGLALRNARVDWPRRGAPRLHAAFDGQLDAPLLREVLAAQGIERLGGKVAIEAEARGERELRDPAQWRVTARISNGTLPIGGGLPAVDKLAGALRYSSGQLRGLTLTGSWLGGPVEVESRKSGSGGGISFALNGVADATLLLRLMGQEAVAQRVAGQFAWSGTAQPGPGSGDWKLSLTSSLGGVESGLPAPFDKPRARGLPVEAQLAISRGGVGEFRVESGRVLDVHGRILDGVTHAQFEVQGVAGEFRHGEAGESEIHVRQLDFSRSPQVLAAAGAVLPAENELNISIDEARFGARNLGALQATITQQEGGVAFSIESADAALHQLSAQGECTSDRRCRSEFSAATRHLAALLADARLPAEWPATSLSAVGSLDWPLDAGAELARSLSGSFEIKAAGDDDDHQLTASATLANGQLTLAGLQGTGPEPDLVFRGEGRLGLTSRDYDFTIDYERVSLAAAAVPSPARTRLARAWHTLRGSAARRGWTEAPETRRVQLHGTWD